MEIFSVKIDMIQEIDHHQASSTLMGDGYFMSEDNSCFVIETKDESNYPILMRIILPAMILYKSKFKERVILLSTI